MAIILLKLLAIFAVIAWSFFVLITQYIWCKHIIWVISLTINFAIWASLIGFIFSSHILGWCCFIGIYSWYLYRFYYTKNKSTMPYIIGDIKIPSIHMHFLMTTSFLNIAKCIPNKANQLFLKKTGIALTIHELITLIINSSRGANIFIKDNKTLVNINIH